MKQYSLKISSKNEKSLNNFLSFFFNHLRTKFNIIQKSVTTRNNKKVITLLKSPHVNKTAQEQFEIRVFSKQVLTKAFYLEKSLVFLKKVLNKLFQDLSVSLEFITNKSKNTENKLVVFYPDNFKLFANKSCETNLKRSEQKNRSKTTRLRKNVLFDLTKFLNIMSLFGEILTVN